MLKQYVIVPRIPKMSPGKIASQVAHATFMALEKFKDTDSWISLSHATDVIEEWKRTGMCVIVLQCRDKTALMSINEYLNQWKIPHHMYIDEGYTEVPMGTPTALATGILNSEHEWIFKNLKLYKN